MSQDHQAPADREAADSRNDAPASDAAARPDPAPLTDPLQVLIQASQAAESLQTRFAELQTLQSEIEGEREQLIADRAAFEKRAGEFAENAARDRVEQRQLRSDLDEESRRIQQLADSLEEGHARLRQSTAELQAERVRLQQEAASELATERDSLQRQQAEIEEEREGIARQQAELESSFQERQQEAEQQLESERAELREKIREEFNAEFSQLQRERQEWSEQQQLEQDQLREEAENLQQQRELLGEQISAEQSRLRNELEKRRQALLTEQTNLQRRYRFQFEHLARARKDFDSEVQQLRRDQQAFRAERHSFQEQHRLQLVKLSRIRELLEDRETSLKRELQVIERNRTVVQMDLQRQRKRLQEHRDAVNHELEERTRQVILQEASIAESTQRLAEKTQQLNRLRADLDAQQCDLLELRIIMEEIQADLQKECSDAELNSRKQRARESLEGFFEELHQRNHTECQEVAVQLTELEENRAAFRRDREQLKQWFENHQGQWNQSAADAPSEPSPDLLDLKEELNRLRIQWAADISRSEAKLRDALDELESLHRSAFSGRPPDEPEDDSQRIAA